MEVLMHSIVVVSMVVYGFMLIAKNILGIKSESANGGFESSIVNLTRAACLVFVMSLMFYILALTGA